MPLEDDMYGYFFNGLYGYPRKNKRFTGLLSNGIPFIGRITYYAGVYKCSLEGKFNKFSQIIGIGKQRFTGDGMIAIGNHDENGKLQGQARKTFEREDY
mgnify:CR=1 FL=1